MMKRILFFSLMILLTSCATPPSSKELAVADYGSPIQENEAHTVAKEFLQHYLKDPESAVIHWGTLEKSWMREGLIYGGGAKYGYKLTASIKAKNSYGAYTGYKQYVFMLHNGKVISAYAEKTQTGAYGSTTALSKIY